MARVLKAAIACSVIFVGLTLGSATAFAASPSSGSIQVWLTPSFTGHGGKILITGAIADYGITKGKKSGKVVLRKGTITVNLSQFNTAMNNVNPTINPTNCSTSFTTTAPVPIVSGTGAYTGITGSFTLNAQYAAILPKSKSGSCNTSNSAEPLTQYASIIGSGSVTLP